MTNSYGYNGVDDEAIDAGISAARDAIDIYTQREQEKQQRQEEEVQAEEQAVSEQIDPRNAETWGAKALIKEGQSILSGGLQDTASSLATFPERTIDALSGEMQREKQEKGFYKPEFTPFDSYDNPIETKTWWGKQLRALVHFGTLAVGAVGAAKAVAATGLVTVPAGLVGLTSSSLARGAAVGAVSDLISKESDEQNALGALSERYGWADTPLATKDTDHPVMMKIKNIVEGMGIGLLFDGIAYTLKKGSKGAVDQIKARNKSIDKQTIEAGVAQLREGELQFRADKNRPVADPHQGAHISEVDPQQAREQLSRTRNEWGSEEGSAGSVTTPVERERIALKSGSDDATIERIARTLMSSEKFAKEMEAVKGNRQALVAKFREAIEGHQAITNGRDASNMSAGEYLKNLFETNDVIDGQEVWTSKNVVIGDLVVGTLLKQLQDTGIAGREIADIVDISTIDGPTKQIVDTMLTALYETKKARLIKSDSFRELGAGKKRKDAIDQVLKEEVKNSKEAIQTVLKIADDDEDLLMAMYEAFSMMKDVNTLDDFDRWARNVLLGGKLEQGGVDRTGTLIRELEGVMTNSILSGPKTPARAIMGTATATFLRPVATALGAFARAPFTGDVATLRASLASVNAMVESIPESFTLFRSKLNSYWKGDISSIKTRYAEYTKGDENWEILRRWAEDSGRATPGEQAAFRVANMARNMNNNNFLTYSTKIMAATDDAFGFILGRAKMREKAMRRVLELQEGGYKTPKITKDLMKAYEDDFYAQVFDPAGNLTDEAASFARKEVTLTQELTGFAKGLNDVFTAAPLAKPFFLFARTGVNGLALTGKYTPGFNFLVKEFNDIATASASNLDNVAKYGITSVEELANAKALQTGRLAMGSAVTFMAAQAWMRGDLNGNGPVDRQKRQAWLDGKWEPRTIKLGAVRVGYDQFEPFNLIMSTIADVGDASELMGEEWTERELQKISLVVAQAITSKSYLAGIQSFVDLFAGRPGQFDRIIAGLANNQVPLAGLRNEMGKLFTPYMREIGSGIDQSVRNRNLIMENFAGYKKELPIKYDLLNGKPLKDWDFMTRAFNAVSPVSLSLDQGPGRQLLFDSGYDLRMSTYYAPDGTNLTDVPEVRSRFQQAIGVQNLERELDKLSKDPKIIASMEKMYEDIRFGKRGQYDARDYYHNIIIKRLFDKARKVAWSTISQESDISQLVTEQEARKELQELKKAQTANILNIYK
jgi:hypothetical protein|tara:strand:- start:321 stop:4013 length:3693 start_codon:yes stop_codon:yes gene_type:complete